MALFYSIFAESDTCFEMAWRFRGGYGETYGDACSAFAAGGEPYSHGSW